MAILAGTPAIARAAPSLLYETNVTENIQVINTSTNAVNAVVPVGQYAQAIAITPDGRFAYVAGGTTGKAQVSVINTSTNSVVATIPGSAGGEGIAITPDGKFAYVTSPSSRGSVSVIDTSSNTVVATVPVAQYPDRVAITPNGEFAYVTTYTIFGGCGCMSVISTSTNTVVATVPDVYGENLAITPDGAFVYLASGSVISTSTNTVVATVPEGGGGGGIAITPNGKFAYVSFLNGGGVSVISTSTNTVVATVAGYIREAGSGDGMAITPDGKCLYAANEGGISVINTATNSLATTVLNGGGTRSGLAILPGSEASSCPAPITTPTVPTTPTTPTTTSTSTAPSTPTGATLASKSKRVPLSPALAFLLPSAKQCVSRRHFTVHVRRYPGITWIGAVIKINGRRIKAIGRSHISTYVNLVGLPKGRFVLSITATASNGQKVTGTRTYHTCVPKSKRHHGPGKL